MIAYMEKIRNNSVKNEFDFTELFLTFYLGRD